MLLGGLLTVVLFVLWAYCIFDVITTEDSSVQHLPKMIWLLIVIFLPSIGSIAWLLLGRPSGKSFSIASNAGTIRPPTRRQRAPEPPPPAPDKPQMSPEEYQRRREEAIKRHEEELRRKQAEPPGRDGNV